ncbi:MAG: hypothetical protein ACRD2W_01215 [Acidimicrobiales bacterium]
MEGGSANAYSYCSGDSINCLDLTGLEDGTFHGPVDMSPRDRLIADCAGPDMYGADISGSAHCGRVRAATRSGDFSEFGIGFVAKTRPKYLRCPKWVRTLAETAGVGGVARAYDQLGSDPGKAAQTLAKTAGIYASEDIAFRIARLSKFAPYVTAGATAVDALCTNL